MILIMFVSLLFRFNMIKVHVWHLLKFHFDLLKLFF